MTKSERRRLFLGLDDLTNFFSYLFRTGLISSEIYDVISSQMERFSRVIDEGRIRGEVDEMKPVINDPLKKDKTPF